MTRRFTKILAALVLLVGLTIPMGMWGQTRAEGDTHEFSQNLEQLLNNNASISSINIAAQSYPVKKVTISYRYNKTIQNAVTMAVSVNGVSWGTAYSTGTGSNYTTVDFEGTSATGAIVISFTNNTGSGTGHGTFYVDKVILTEGPGGTAPTTYTVTYNANGGTGTMTDSNSPYTAGATVTVLGNEFTRTDYEFDHWNTAADDSGTSYDEDDTFTINANTTLYAQWTENTTPTPGGITAILNIAAYAEANSWINSTQYTTATVAPVTFTANGGGNTGKYYESGHDWRFYQGESASITITVPEGYTLVSVTPTYSVNNSGVLKNGNATIASGTTVNVSGTSVTFTVGNSGSATNGQVRFTNIDVVYVSDGSTQTTSDLTITNQSTDLTFDLYNNTTAQVISYTTSSTGAITITPAESDYFSYVHDAAAKTITVTPTAVTPSAQTVTINQAADDDYYAGTATFTVSVANSDPNLPGTQNNPYTVAQARAAINAGTGTQGVYATGIVSSIETAWSTQYSNITFNFVDNAGDTDFLQAFRCVSGTGVDASTVAVGDVVVVYGNLTKYGSIYEFGQGCELVSLIHSAVPSITVNPDEVNVDATPAAGEDFIEGTLDLTWENLEITDFFEDFAIQYYDAEGEELADDPNWIMVDLATQDPNIGEGYLVSYMIEENEGTEARTAYFKVFALGDEDYVYSNMVTVNQAAPVVPPTPGNWVLTNLADLTEDDIFVIVGTDADDDTFALPNDGGASTAPSATAITIVEGTISGEPAEKLQWNLSGNATDGYTFYPNGETETWLYCTNTNNGVRVGTNDNKIFKMDEDGYLVNDATTRVLSIYVNNGTPQDWRCYSNYNNNPVVISFYKKIETHTIQYSVNGVIIDALQQTSPTLVPSSLEEYESYVPNGYYFKGWIEGEEISLTQEEPNIISDIELYNPTADVTLKAVFAICDYDAINCSNYCTRAYPINGRLTNEITETDKAYYVDRGELGDQGAFVAHNDVVTINGALGNFDPNALSIQQGGELIVNNAVSVQMNEWVNGNSWCFIASPLIDEVPAENIGAFGSYSHQTYDTEDPKYNLYFYDEPTHWWRSYQNGIYAGFNIEPGTGYLYSVEQDGDQDFQYVGLIQPYVEDGIAIDLKYTATIDGEENPLAGWNLVGNPFPFTTTIDKSFYYVINNTITPAEEGTLVGPCTGAFVRAQTTGETVTFTKAENMGKSSSIGISVVGETMRGNSWANVDKAIVSFSGSQLEKFVFDADNAKLYIPQNGMDYAIVSTEAQGELPVNFRANKNGTFTLSMDVENMDMNYLHLIDNMTGMDVDLLQTPSYTFEAKVNDYESRFRLVFAANNEDGVSTGSTTFAFYSNGNWIINNAGEATLQVVDLTGRILSSETVNGSVSKTINAVPGVYMLRLINGDNVNVQKIVVR